MNYSIGNIKIDFEDYESYDLISDINGDGIYNDGTDLQAIYTKPGVEIIDIEFIHKFASVSFNPF